MNEIELGYGDSHVKISVEGASSVTWLTGKELAPITDPRSAFYRAVTEDVIDSPPLCDVVKANDLVTIVVSDVTRLWSRHDIVCRELVSYLHGEIGVPYNNMVILVALGTHRAQSEEECRKVVTPEVYENVKVICHDCLAPDMVYLGTTSRGTRVSVNPLAVGRKLILIGSTVHHLMSGFGGGRKSVLPGISSKETILQNHLHCLDKESPRSNPEIGPGILEGNPVHEDMTEAAELVSPAFGINIVSNGHDQLAYLCGHWNTAFLESCRLVNETFGVPLKEQADIVIASCGGYPKDINLYQGVKTLLNMAGAVKPGGTMVFLAECREGGGADDFFRWRIPLQEGRLYEALRDDYTIAGYIFFAGCEYIRRGTTYMLTGFYGDLTKQVLDDMNIRGYNKIDELLEQIDFTGKSVYIMPYGGNTVPYLL